jgi:hypothetical protein
VKLYRLHKVLGFNSAVSKEQMLSIKQS